MLTHRCPAWLVLVAALAALGSSAGACKGTAEVGPPAGGAAGSTPDAGAGGQGASAECNAPPDGLCDGEEDCACTLCQVSALCTPFGCLADGLCNPPLEDSCTCSDCDWDWKCLSLDGSTCLNDGTCDYLSEGCACEDCREAPGCLDNVLLCKGAVPNGVCEHEVEGCECPDCLGALPCMCEDTCMIVCLCPACWGDPWCEDPDWCWNDGICQWDLESCICNDCLDATLCVGYPG